MLVVPIAIAAAVALAAPLPTAAADASPALEVKVLPDRYLAAGKSFSSLAALEAWAAPVRVRSLSLNACGSAASQRVIAAVERFQSAYSDGIRIRALPVGDPACAPAEAEHLAVDEAGRGRLP